jgi:hypothetical protein
MDLHVTISRGMRWMRQGVNKDNIQNFRSKISDKNTCEKLKYWLECKIKMYVTGMEDISKLGHTFEQSYV